MLEKIPQQIQNPRCHRHPHTIRLSVISKPACCYKSVAISSYVQLPCTPTETNSSLGRGLRFFSASTWVCNLAAHDIQRDWRNSLRHMRTILLAMCRRHNKFYYDSSCREHVSSALRMKKLNISEFQRLTLKFQIDAAGPPFSSKTNKIFISLLRQDLSSMSHSHRNHQKLQSCTTGLRQHHTHIQTHITKHVQLLASSQTNCSLPYTWSAQRTFLQNPIWSAPFYPWISTLVAYQCGWTSTHTCRLLLFWFLSNLWSRWVADHAQAEDSGKFG